jgi:hypothetical protein
MSLHHREWGDLGFTKILVIQKQICRYVTPPLVLFLLGQNEISFWPYVMALRTRPHQLFFKHLRNYNT